MQGERLMLLSLFLCCVVYLCRLPTIAIVNISNSVAQVFRLNPKTIDNLNPKLEDPDMNIDQPIRDQEGFSYKLEPHNIFDLGGWRPRSETTPIHHKFLQHCDGIQ